MKTKGEKIIDIIGGMPDGETRPLEELPVIEEEKLSGKTKKLMTVEEFYEEEPVEVKKDKGLQLFGSILVWLVGTGIVAAIVYVIILLVKAIIAQL